MVQGTLRCTKCGNTDTFRGTQSCRGSVTVTVDTKGNWIGNATEDGSFPHNDLDFDNPEGPWSCALCGSDEIEEVKDG